jgi:hypothetical protein
MPSFPSRAVSAPGEALGIMMTLSFDRSPPERYPIEIGMNSIP